MASTKDGTPARLEAGVYILYGLPGAGKSYFLACLADDYRRAGYPVACNYPIKFTHELKPENINTDLLLSGSVLLIDEAHSIFNSRGFKNFTKTMHEFFSMHRHLGNRLVLATQHPARLDLVIREIADSFIYLSTFKIGSRPILLTARYYYEDPCRSSNIDMDRLLVPYRTERRLYRRHIMASYDTFYVDSDAESIITAERLPLWTGRAFERVTVPEPLAAIVINTISDKLKSCLSIVKRNSTRLIAVLRKNNRGQDRHGTTQHRRRHLGGGSQGPSRVRRHILLRGSHRSRRSRCWRGLRSASELVTGEQRVLSLLPGRTRSYAAPENLSASHTDSRLLRIVRQRTKKIKRLLRKLTKK